LAKDLVTIFLAAKFTSEERHLRRLGKLKALETKFHQNVGARRAVP
jgi:ribose 5-phosphate isomerase RpiB